MKNDQVLIICMYPSIPIELLALCPSIINPILVELFVEYQQSFNNMKYHNHIPIFLHVYKERATKPTILNCHTVQLDSARGPQFLKYPTRLNPSLLFWKKNGNLEVGAHVWIHLQDCNRLESNARWFVFCAFGVDDCNFVDGDGLTDRLKTMGPLVPQRQLKLSFLWLFCCGTVEFMTMLNHFLRHTS